MKKLILILLAGSCFLSASTVNWTTDDLKTATFFPEFVSGGNVNNVFDGEFLAEGTSSVANGSKWWIGTQPSWVFPVLYFSFNQAHAIETVIVQAGGTDTYRLEYADGSVWKTLFNVPTVNDDGLKTRAQFVSPVTASEFRFYATGGDGLYAVSEIQLWGNSPATQASGVPEPATWAMLASGSALLLLRRRKVS